MDGCDRLAGIKHQVMVRVDLRQGHEVLADPLMKFDRLAFDAIAAGEAIKTVIRLLVEQHGQMRPQVTCGPTSNRRQLLLRDGSPCTLLGQSGVDIAIGDHDFTSLEGGHDHVIDVLGLVGCIKQRLGSRRQLSGGRIEQDLTHLLAGPRAAWLPSQEH